jgi:uncharacterized protein (DUF983 family)
MRWVLVAAFVLLVIGSIGVIVATIMEYVAQHAIWELLMKIFPWVFGLGAVLFAYWLAKSKGEA